VDDTDASLPRYGDRQFGFRDCIHGRAEKGNINLYGFCKLRADVRIFRQDVGFRRQKKNVIECEAYRNIIFQHGISFTLLHFQHTNIFFCSSATNNGFLRGSGPSPSHSVQQCPKEPPAQKVLVFIGRQLHHQAQRRTRRPRQCWHRSRGPNLRSNQLLHFHQLMTSTDPIQKLAHFSIGAMLGMPEEAGTLSLYLRL
jgi:hypothetical protein